MAKKTRVKKTKGGAKKSASNSRVANNKPLRPRLNRRERQEILTFAKGLARAAGALAMSYYGRANPLLRYDHDLVTEADLAVQDYIRKEVKGNYPEHRFMGEEGARKASKRDKTEALWVVDPVDGSAGFSAGMPVWGVSIALFDGGKPVIGIIHLPVTGEVYSAMAGGPAMLNDREISVQDLALDNESLLLTYSRFHMDFVTHLTGKVRSLGSTAAHMAYVARGAASCAILGNVHVWDLAAGSVLLEAAGGSLCDLDGKKVDLAVYLNGEKIDKVIIAAPKGLHGDVASLLESRD
jgi:myo-inositol-1(or 4)-monophosphatase